MKTLFFTASILLLVDAIHAQKIITEYVDRDGYVSTKSKCYAYTVAKQKYNAVDYIYQYYCSTGKVKSVLQVNEMGNWNGYSTGYFEDGKMSLKAKFEKSVLVDTFYAWYPSGKPHYEKYAGKKGENLSKLISYWDSVGNQLVKDGHGYCSCIFGSGNGLDEVQKGKIVDGERDSTWNFFTKTGLKIRREHYKNGVSVKDDPRKLDTDSTSHFSVVEESANPVGGMAAFYEVIARNIKYPAFAKRQGVQGKVFVEFIVEKDGTISNVRTIKGIGGGCDEEAERVVRLSPNWNPGLLHGKPVRQKMVLPITFKTEFKNNVRNSR
jgi:TonB family protein